MTRNEYENYINTIVSGQFKDAPYDDPLYLDYSQLNTSRYFRWLKKGQLNTELVSIIQQSKFTNWIVITEPWCGDAAHTVPFISLLSEQNPLIKIEYELRDSAPFRIDHYLTNGTSKSIPIVLFRNDDEERVWGPRPQALSNLFEEMKTEKELTFDEMKMELQKWYNCDKGYAMQLELIKLLK